MPGPARAGALIYAKDLERLSHFYQTLLSMQLLSADAEHHVIESADIQLIIHAIPPHIAATFEIATPPVPREEQAIKLFFTVPSLSSAAALAASLGGSLFGQEYAGPGFKLRNGYDPEGNIFQVRENAS
jgi:predicted enzyme related to lactoylglutathione lyase